eukprot:365482-Chlamydomonas_euryale.AAC.4
MHSRLTWRRASMLSRPLRTMSKPVMKSMPKRGSWRGRRWKECGWVWTKGWEVASGSMPPVRASARSAEAFQNTRRTKCCIANVAL